MQPIDKGNETRVDGGKARQEKIKENRSGDKSAYDRQNASGDDGQITDPTGQVSGGYVGSVGELQRNNDARHPTSKVWTRRDRSPDDYLHTGNG